MTIIFFSRLFYPHVGGVEKHVLEIGKRLVNKGHKVVVVTEELGDNYQYNDTYHYSGKKDEQARLLRYARNDDYLTNRERLQNNDRQTINNIEGIEIIRIKAGNDWFKKFMIWKWLFRHKDLLARADIVHCHDIFFWYLPFRFIYPRKPVYTTFHGYETRFPLTKRAIFIRKLSEKLSWGNICVGDFIKKWYGTKPSYTTYGGVEILPINTNPTQYYRLPSGTIRTQFMERLSGAGTTNTTNKYQSKSNKLRILLLGRLEEDNGVQIYLKALEMLRNNKIDFSFEAVGDGSCKTQIEKYGKVYGFVEDVSPFIEKADIVFTSSYLSILESLSFKKPVFAVYNNALKKDYLELTPFAKHIVIENSPEKLVERIKYFMNNKKEKEYLVLSGYQWVKQQTWDRVTDIYLRLWKIEE